MQFGMGESDLKAPHANVLGTFSDFTRDDNYSLLSHTRRERERKKKRKIRATTTCDWDTTSLHNPITICPVSMPTETTPPTPLRRRRLSLRQSTRRNPSLAKLQQDNLDGKYQKFKITKKKGEIGKSWNAGGGVCEREEPPS